MRALSLLLPLVLFVASAPAEERTWTISTGTYAMAAELVEVRGDIAYLKTADRVEHIPLARLSHSDMQFIASQSPEIIFPRPVDEPLPMATAPTPEDAPLQLVAPANSATAPVVQGNTQNAPIAARRRQPVPATANQLYRAEELLPAPVARNQPANRATTIERRAMYNPNARRTPAAQRPPQNVSANQNRSRDNNERPGLFGFRARRNGNQR